MKHLDEDILIDFLEREVSPSFGQEIQGLIKNDTTLRKKVNSLSQSRKLMESLAKRDQEDLLAQVDFDAFESRISKAIFEKSGNSSKKAKTLLSWEWSGWNLAAAILAGVMVMTTSVMKSVGPSETLAPAGVAQNPTVQSSDLIVQASAINSDVLDHFLIFDSDSHDVMIEAMSQKIEALDENQIQQVLTELRQD